MGLLDDVLMRTRKPLLDIDELTKGKPLPDGYNFSQMNTNAPAPLKTLSYEDIANGGTRPTTPADPMQWSQSGRIQNRLPEWQEVAEGKSDALAGARSLGATRTTPTPTPEPSPAPSPAPSRPMRPPMEFARNNGPPVPPTRPAEYNQTSLMPPTRPAGLGGPPLPPSRQLALGEPNLPRAPDIPPPSIPRTALAPPPEIASTRAAANDINAGPTGPVKAPMNRSLNMNEIPRGYGYWDDGTVRNAQGQSAPIFGPTRGEAASDILSKVSPAAGTTSLPRLGNMAKAGNFIDSNAVKPAIETGLLGPAAPSLGTAIPQASASPAIVGPPVGSAIPGAKDKDADSAMPDITDADFAPGGDSGGDSGGITDADFGGGDMGGMLGGMGGGGMGAIGGLLGMMGSLMGGGKKDSGFDPPPKAPSVPPPGAASQPEMQRAAAEKQSAQQILSGILAGNQHSLLDRKRPYA